MTRYAIVILLLLFSAGLNAQKNHFIYIQTETPQHFYVKLDAVVRNASPAGYVIIPELKAGKHSFTIGFPDNTISDQSFEIQLNENDRSFLLKNFDDKGWGLYDLQEMSITQASPSQPGFKLKPAEEVSAFTDVLARASGDSTIRFNAIIEKPKTSEVNNDVTREVSSENRNNVSVTENTQAKNSIEVAQQGNENEAGSGKIKEADKKVTTVEQVTIPEVAKIITTQNYRPSKITTLSQNTTNTGVEITYKDVTSDGEADTISISFDFAVENLAAKEKTAPASNLKFLDVSSGQDNPNRADDKKETVDVAAKPVTQPNDQCKAVATEKEINQVRNKMALAVTDETMIIEAQKLFIKKCMTSSQVKRLSELFVTNAGKYSFFNAVYDHVSDKQYFYTLQGELKDEHYKGRFLNILQK